MAKEKKKKIPKSEWQNEQWISHYRKQWLCFRILTYVVLVLPFLTLLGVKFDYYFPLDTLESKLQFSGSVLIGIACVLLASLQIAKKIEKKEITLFFTSFYWFATFFISIMLKNFFNDISLICLVVGIGVLSSATCNVIAQNRKKRLDNYIQGTIFGKTSRNEYHRKSDVRSEKEAVD